MNWQRIGPNFIEDEHGYRISRSRIDDRYVFRASHQGSFIGAPVHSLEEAKTQAEQHHQEAA